MINRKNMLFFMVGFAILTVGCGNSTTSSSHNNHSGDGTLSINPQGSTFLVGVDRLSLAVLDVNRHPVNKAQVQVEIVGQNGVISSSSLEYIGPQYGDIPVYLGVVKFSQTGQFQLIAHATLSNGKKDFGTAYVNVTNKSPELPVGYAVPATANQKINADVGGNLPLIDTGVPPDNFHDHNIAEGLAQHHPMILYFGEPGRCVTQTCGPTVQVLQKLAATYSDSFWFEHIEIHDPAQSEALSGAYIAFKLTSEPWIYLVNSSGVVADRFEGPLTLDQLKQAADGTLAGNVPAVNINNT